MIYKGEHIVAVNLFLAGCAVAMWVVLPVFFPGALLLVFSLLMLRGYFVVEAGQIIGVFLFGKLKETWQKQGLFWTHPLAKRKSLTSGSQHTRISGLLLNDKEGQTISVTVSASWRINDPKVYLENAFDASTTVPLQIESILTKIFRFYPFEATGVQAEKGSIKYAQPGISKLLSKELGQLVNKGGLLLEQVWLGEVSLVKENFSGKYKAIKPEEVEKIWADAQYIAKVLKETNNWPQNQEEEKKCYLSLIASLIARLS